MTMRTYFHYVCANGHKGVQKISENDQPYSTPWEQRELTGMREGDHGLTCEACGLPMTETKKPTD
jgi:hypothetical protein